jgi:hypothetical protein
VSKKLYINTASNSTTTISTSKTINTPLSDSFRQNLFLNSNIKSGGIVKDNSSKQNIDVISNNLSSNFPYTRLLFQSLLSNTFNQFHNESPSDIFANFTYSYYYKIYSARYWQPINN